MIEFFLPALASVIIVCSSICLHSLSLLLLFFSLSDLLPLFVPLFIICTLLLTQPGVLVGRRGNLLDE